MAGVVAVALVGVGMVGILVTRGDATPSVALGPPRYVDETQAAGIDHTFGGSSTYSVGGGVAVFDCNGDGRPEMYLAGGGNSPAALYRNDSTIGGALHFTLQPDPATDLADVNGAYPLDIDGDGNVDLAVLRVGENVLLRGLGDCRFERANEALRFDGGAAQTTAFSATWEGSGLPTLAIGNYLQLDATGESGLDCDTSELVRPASSGTSYAPPLTSGAGLLHALDAVQRLGRFRAPRPAGLQRSALLRRRQRSGTALADRPGRSAAPVSRCRRVGEGPDRGDGHRQLRRHGRRVPGRVSHEPGTQQAPDADRRAEPADLPRYRLQTACHGLCAIHGRRCAPSTAWHPEFQDVNNDGFIDLFVSKGNVDEIPDYAAMDPSNLLLGQPDGTFQEVAESAGVLDFARGRGAALADFNLDGMLDLVKVNLGAPVRLWRNVGAGDAAQPGADGPLAGGDAASARSEPRRHRVLDRGPGRRHDDATRTDRRRRAHRGPTRADPLRAGTGGRGSDPGAMAGRRAGAVDPGQGRPVDHHRARRNVS